MNLTGTILIADDDKMTLDFFDITLSKLGFEVIKAEDGIEALKKIKLYSPDMILLDNILPRLTGFEVTKRLRRSKIFRAYRDVPIIMFSALNDPSDKVTGLEMGVDDYIAKPFNFSEVLARIRSILRHRELSNRLLRKQRKMAILESLNTNLVTFTRHIKKPLSDLHKEIGKLNTKNEVQVKKFIKKFEDNYKEMSALLESLEDEIRSLESNNKDNEKGEFSLEKLERNIAKHLKEAGEKK